MMHKPVVYEKPLEILGITYIGGDFSLSLFL